MQGAPDNVLLFREAPPIDPDTARDLWVAVMKLAILDLSKGPGRSREQSRNYWEARSWLLAEDTAFPSFVCLCEHLDWDPGTIRRQLGDRLHRRG